MRRAVAPLLLALAIVSPLAAQSAATSGPTTRYSRLYVFGDSYSDIGAGYIDGNGPTAVAYLGWLMGLQVASSTAANAVGKSLVFAVSGAGTLEGTGRHVKEALLGYGMMNRVRDFAARVKAGVEDVLVHGLSARVQPSARGRSDRGLEKIGFEVAVNLAFLPEGKHHGVEPAPFIRVGDRSRQLVGVIRRYRFRVMQS